ncbi:MAG TPA: 4'-phosphopantetheinyl transferase superfamily protein [Moraxellaceae bacterium]|nr:4'-phosphopantetheinyl transferase superfamily protein [Moraxellaceae bacterium]
MITVRLAWLRDDPARPLAPLAARLDATAAAELAGLRLPSRQRGHLLSRALLRYLLATTPALAGKAARFDRAPSGRLLLAAPAGWHISVSHAPERVAVLLASVPGGIDIERPRPVRYGRVAARYFAPAEQDWLASLSGPEAARDFFRLWTLKEAAAKALGEGIAHNLARLAFALDGPVPVPLDPGLGLQAWQAPAGDAWLAGVVRAEGPVAWECREVALDTLLAG